MIAAIFLFCRTPSMAKPWADAGAVCYLVDTQHAKGERHEGNIVYVGADARYWRPPVGITPIFIACFPSCTHLAVSGARWFKGKGLRLLAESIELFAVAAELCEWAECPYFIENPVSVVSSHWRKPDYTFHPWEYAGYLPDIQKENTTKLTCLWTGGGFIVPAKAPAPGPHRNDVWKMGPSEDRADQRAVSPEGFAQAVFLTNAPLQLKKTA